MERRDPVKTHRQVTVTSQVTVTWQRLSPGSGCHLTAREGVGDVPAIFNILGENTIDSDML